MTHLGPEWEHVQIQQGAKGLPLAKQKWLRQALITTLNRSAAARALYGALNPRVGVLNRVSRLTNEKTYNPKHFNKWNYNPAEVNQMMNAHNCSKGGDGIFRCGRTKLSFDFASTAGNALVWRRRDENESQTGRHPHPRVASVTHQREPPQRPRPSVGRTRGQFSLVPHH